VIPAHVTHRSGGADQSVFLVCAHSAVAPRIIGYATFIDAEPAFEPVRTAGRLLRETERPSGGDVSRFDPGETSVEIGADTVKA
jgi:hypothetical protein